MDILLLLLGQKVQGRLSTGEMMFSKKSSASLSVINLKGDAVSMVTSLGDVFGSKVNDY